MFSDVYVCLFVVVQIIDVVHPGRANLSKAELSEKVAEVQQAFMNF